MRLAIDNSAAVPDTGPRRALLAQVHIARKALAIADDDYRAMLERVTGHDSAKDCTLGELRSAIEEFVRMGFRSAGAARRRDLGAGATVRKARAMWILLYQLGAIEDGSDAALEAFGRRQLHVDRLRWANEREGFRLIEALKAMAERNGWSQRLPSRLSTGERIHILKDRLVGAQLARLVALGSAATGPLAEDRESWSDKRLESAAKELAARIREARATRSQADAGV
ncbi:MAG: regulatory protein GemA [Novosphingobium sp.]